MSDDAIEKALKRGDNASAAKAAGEHAPESLRRDPVYTMVYVGGLVVLAVLVAVFLM